MLALVISENLMLQNWMVKNVSFYPDAAEYWKAFVHVQRRFNLQTCTDMGQRPEIFITSWRMK